MTKIAAILFAAAAGSASAFTSPAGATRSFTRTISYADAAAPADVEEVAAAPVDVEEVAAAPVPEPEPVGFCLGYVGAEGPEPIPFALGGSSVEFDPAGFASRSPEWLPWYREAELKHGRAAMLATVGFVVPEFIRIPGEQFSFENVPNVIEAHDKLPDSMGQIFLWISLLEACTIPALAGMSNPLWDRAPGDFSFDPIGLFPDDPAKQKEMQLAELKNGRLAMIALGGMIAGAAITGQGFPYIQY